MLHNPNAVKQLVRTEQAYKSLKNVCGSPVYWKNELYDVLAMLHSLGIPTWFLTLSAADLHWPEIIQAIAVQIGQHLSHENILKLSIAERSRYLQQNPVTCVCMFQHHVDSFFMHYLLNKTQPLGAIIDLIKIEFQMRGAPHAHCLLLVKDSPKINVNKDEEICHFIDKYITAVLPTGHAEYKEDVKLMENFQKHTHSDYCQRKKRCLFGFPKPPSYKTVISQEVSDDGTTSMTVKDAMDLLKSLQNKLTTQLLMCATMTLDNILKDLKMDIETYTNALRISQKGQHIILKCDVEDIFINACNSDILALWQGIIDLQYVVDEYSTVMYVCNYMMKGEKALGETLKRVAKECRNDDLWTQMKKIKKKFLGKRVLGAQESAMHVLSMWLMKKNRKVVTVNTNMKDERTSLRKPGYRLAQLAEDDEDVLPQVLLTDINVDLTP